MPAIKKTGSIKPFFLSALLHLLGIYLLAIFPPTKSLIFFKIQKPVQNPLSSTKEKVLDEISVITIPKKPQEEGLAEVLSEEIGTVAAQEDFIPHIDLSKNLGEKLDLSFPIDPQVEFQLADLQKSSRSIDEYLTPLSSAIPDELLEDEEPKALSFEPKPKQATKVPTIESQVALIDDLGLPNITKMMPEMLDTELYTYKDLQSEDYFKMELKLKDHKLFEDVPQEFLFVVDLTQKSSRKNLSLYKDAIFKSIKLLKSKDKFNIVFLNKSFSSIYTCSKHVASVDLKLLEEMFTKQASFNGKYKDFLKNLATLFDKTEENELHTNCLVFTEEPSSEADNLLKLAKYAHSKLSVYPIAYSETKQKREALTSFVEKIGGKTLYPPTKAAFARKFTGLILDIKKTRLRNVSVKLESEDGKLDFSLSEKTKQLTLQKPLKIFGKLKGAQTLKLHIVGSHGDDLFEMTKNLSIQEAKKGSSLIKQELENHN